MNDSVNTPILDVIRPTASVPVSASISKLDDSSSGGYSDYQFIRSATILHITSLGYHWNEDRFCFPVVCTKLILITSFCVGG